MTAVFSANFRETEYKILDTVEAIQDHLDDHLLKTQIMRGSPYFKAFESKFMYTILKINVRRIKVIFIVLNTSIPHSDFPTSYSLRVALNKVVQLGIRITLSLLGTL